MYVILSYDVGKKRVGKALKTCRKCLNHRHKSVFEGDLTQAELAGLEKDLASVIPPETDSACIFKVE